MLATPARLLAGLALVAGVLALGNSADAASGLRHFELRRAFPAADTTLPAPPELVQLWFSEEPQSEGARIRLLDAAGELVEMGPTIVVPDTATSLRAVVPAPLPAGNYTVHWRAMARDGHVVTGEIPFAVRADGSR